MSHGESPDGSSTNGDARSPDELRELRELLIGPEQRDLAELRARFEDRRARAEDLSDVLPRAVNISTARDAQLSKALAPTVETALRASVRKDPRVITDIVFPIIGPAIRKALAEALNKMLDAINTTLEHSFSVQGFKWRIEAWRTGQKFSDVVLARTLKYWVEDVFLIHKETGLLLAHAHSDRSGAKDSDMISGMLTAIQDFSRDSFTTEKGSTIETAKIGNLHLWIESNAQLIIAATIRGHAPVEYRATLQQALEQVVDGFQAALNEFAGDAAPFAGTRPILDECLHAEPLEIEHKRSPLLWILPALFLTGAIVLGSYLRERASLREEAEAREAVAQHLRRLAPHRAARAAELRARELDAIEEARWAKYVKRLNAEEGIVITEASRRDGMFQLAGLRDPLAADPQSLIAESGADAGRLIAKWEPYLAMTPGIVLKRATQRLAPPANVTLSLRGDTLMASGSAPAAWIATARSRAEAVPGIAVFDASAVLDETLAALVKLKRAVDETTIYFGEGVDLEPEQEEAAHALARQIAELRTAARASKKQLRVTVTGHTTEVGGETYNLKLSRNRADRVISLLVGDGIDAVSLTPVAAAAHERKFLNAEDDLKNRRVTFIAAFDDIAPASSLP
jgi:OOP family OmpA-OmpF porin